MLDLIGLHYMESGDYAAAKPWFERSLRYQGQGNDIARNYLELANTRMLEAATNEVAHKLEILLH